MSVLFPDTDDLLLGGINKMLMALCVLREWGGISSHQ